MSKRVFIDTNVLIYSRDDRFPEKQDLARRWLAEISRRQIATLNPQVIGEFCNAVMKRKLLPDEIARETMVLVEAWSVGHIDLDLIAAAWDLRQATRYQWWDCMILAAAADAGCRYLLSEDMTHQRTVDGVTIINPFKSSPADVLAAH